MASAAELKRIIDCHDLAGRLGLERPHGDNYRSPHREDKQPSLSVFDDGHRWKDHGSGAGGSCIDLVMYTLDMEAGDAIRWLHDTYGIERHQDEGGKVNDKRLSRAEWIAKKCREADAAPAIEYLEGRGIARAAIDQALEAGALGYNDYRSETIPAGQARHGGPAVAYIVRRPPPAGDVAAVGMRFLDPELNGGLKTQTQGEKRGLVWTPDWRAVARAHTVYVCSGECDALTVHTCFAGARHTAAVACLGDANDTDWSFLLGKTAIIVPDADAPDDKGRCSGREWSWRTHDALTGVNVAALMVDIEPWYEAGIGDLNEHLQQLGADETRLALGRLEEWLICGMPGREHAGRSRVYLPGHDWAQYWRFRHKRDFLTWIKRLGEEQEEGSEKGREVIDVCGFRPVAVSRITVQSAIATMSGRADTQPTTLFAVSAQVARHGAVLQRKVLTDAQVHNLDQWRKFGPIWAPQQFQRAINILERAAYIGSRFAMNYVGLAWREGKPAVSEGPDTYFTDPDRQCPYVDLIFPRTPQREARRVLQAWRALFHDDAGTQVLAWTLGAHLKAFLGYWPHLVLQADKSAGKSTLLHLLSESTAVHVYSGQSLNTEFRLLTSLSYTSHPVAWEELSARSQRVINTAVSLLQESYQYTTTRRGAELTQFLVSAPVVLAGEDVPVRSLTGKTVQVGLTGRKGRLLPRNLPEFPVRAWLDWLATHTADEIRERYEAEHEWCGEHSRATGADDGARRMTQNYAAVLTAWKLLCEFAGLEVDVAFAEHVAAEMNEHIRDTTADREPWVWILELVAGQIASGQYRYPYTFRDVVAGGDVTNLLVIRHSDIMQHLSTAPGLRDWYDALPVKTPRVLRRQLERAGVLHDGRVDATIDGVRHNHMLGLDLARLEAYGIHVPLPSGQSEQHYPDREPGSDDELELPPPRTH